MDDEEAASRWQVRQSQYYILVHNLTCYVSTSIGSPQPRRNPNRPVLRHLLPHSPNPRPRRTRPTQPALHPNPSLRRHKPPIRRGPTSALPHRFRKHPMGRRPARDEGARVRPAEEGGGASEGVGWC